jgi:Flp pilus assembly protein protease CpaA
MITEVLAGGLLVSAAGFRLAQGRIPNGLIAIALGGAVVTPLVGAFPLTGLLAAVGGAVVGLVLGGYLAWLGLAAGGDLKLLIALGALSGPDGLLLSMVAASLLGLVIALSSTVYRRFLPYLLAKVAMTFTLNPLALVVRVDRGALSGRTPLAVLVAVGGLIVLCIGPAMGW